MVVRLSSYNRDLPGLFQLTNGLNDAQLNFLHVAQANRTGKIHFLFHHLTDAIRPFAKTRSFSSSFPPLSAMARSWESTSRRII